VLRARGRLREAERECLEAVRLLAPTIPRWETVAHAELGEVRRRLGDLGGAMESFRKALELGWDPQPGLALLLGAQGDARSAHRAIERVFAARGFGKRAITEAPAHPRSRNTDATARVNSFLTSVRALGKERLRLLWVLTAGHFVIHWFQQFYPVILPTLKSGLNLTNVEVGALTSAQQVAVGLGQLPCGMLADALVRRRGAILALALAAMGAAYFLLGLPLFLWALLGSALIGLGTALWHPTAAASLSNRFPERRATALSIHGTGATISDTLTPLLVGVLLANFSWQTAAQMQLLPGLLFAFLLWRALAGMFSDSVAQNAIMPISEKRASPSSPRCSTSPSGASTTDARAARRVSTSARRGSVGVRRGR